MDAAHEFGHILGFQDTYNMYFWRTAWDGFDNNIMSGASGSMVQDYDIAVMADMYTGK